MKRFLARRPTQWGGSVAAPAQARQRIWAIDSSASLKKPTMAGLIFHAHGVPEAGRSLAADNVP
jgi:hypothetical protein